MATVSGHRVNYDIYTREELRTACRNTSFKQNGMQKPDFIRFAKQYDDDPEAYWNGHGRPPRTYKEMITLTERSKAWHEEKAAGTLHTCNVKPKPLRVKKGTKSKHANTTVPVEDEQDEETMSGKTTARKRTATATPEMAKKRQKLAAESSHGSASGDDNHQTAKDDAVVPVEEDEEQAPVSKEAAAPFTMDTGLEGSEAGPSEHNGDAGDKPDYGSDDDDDEYLFSWPNQVLKKSFLRARNAYLELIKKNPEAKKNYKLRCYRWKVGDFLHQESEAEEALIPIKCLTAPEYERRLQNQLRRKIAEGQIEAEPEPARDEWCWYDYA